ncbi:MAG TPA: N-acetylmuramoyl-L-alanine amidase [Stellaceae bacterium]
MLLLHYTGMPSAGAALDRMRDPAAEVSAHYMIDEDGTVYRLVPEDRRAWHAGRSSWDGETDINSASIGIEIVNPGHEFGYRPFPEPQMAAVDALCRDVIGRHPIPPHRVLGHSDVAPQRKEDPGELFDWPRLARAGIGLWPDFAAAPATDPPADVAAAQALLAAIGYAVPQSGVLDAETAKVLTAFQRRFHPSRCDGALDDETCRRIAAVTALFGSGAGDKTA